jgi:uncharacterized protein (TIGR03546 family)
MTLLLKQIFSFIKLLNSDKGTNQIAAGIACGMVLGFTPAFSLQTILILFCLFFFRIQMGAAFIMAFFFKFIAFALDPVFDWVGIQVLSANGLQALWTTLFHMPIIPLTRFNNSIVMGSGVVAFVLAPLVFVISKKLVLSYRAKVVARFEKTKFWKLIKATRFYQWYAKWEELRG